MRNASVLLLEDDADLRQEVREYLETEGFSIVEAGSLDEARASLRRQPVHAIVLDVGLPDGSGLQALPELRRLGACPVVMMTAWGQLPQRLQGLNNGADYYLVKPVALAELTAVLKRLLSRGLLSDGWSSDESTLSLTSPSGVRLQLTMSEWQFVQALRDAGGQVVGREQLVLALNQEPADYDARRMHSLVQRLRGKARSVGLDTLPVHSRHGEGYVWLDTARIRSG